MENNEEKIIEERKKKLLIFLKDKQIWIFIVLILLVIFGVYIRIQPMTDHGGRPGLWDITTNSWTLGPDLDPWLFTRYAKTIIETGGLPRIDMMRNVPLGFDTTTELQMVSYMIVLTHKLTSIFGYSDPIFAAAFMPVIFFALTIIAFFLFVREIFLRKDSEDKNLKANLIAIISTVFMIVIPVFLSRTVAGIPEKESVAFFFMFLAFYLFLKAWKSEKLIYSIVFSILAGFSTALMGLTWGGVTYIYITLAISVLIAFILEKINKEQGITYFVWILTSIASTFLFTNRYSLKDFFISLDTGLVTVVLFFIIIHFILLKFKIFDKKLSKIKLPKSIITIIISVIILAILVLIFLGPSFITEKIRAISQMMFRPVTGRWSVTVAENKQPYFTEWGASFGPFIKGIPIMFWLFFAGSIVLFKEMLNNLNKKDSWILTCFFTLFLMGMIFSRYAPHPAIFDGEGLISRIVYYGFALLLIIAFIYYYMSYHKKGEKNVFEKISFEYLLLFSLFVLCLFTARSAVRLIMVLGPIAPIFASFLVVDLYKKFRKTKDETMKIIFIACFFIILALALFCFWNYYNSVKSESYSYVPTMYNQQWQKAMEWVRNETPKDAVFAHWWDYGYWLQIIGNRATVVDGGNAIVYWNYLMGRLVLTGDNQKDSLEFLYNHNATNLLIDSSDIGKYGAFASIGSNENYDRYSWIGSFVLDETQTQETKNQTNLVYTGGGIALDEDITIEQDGKEILLPGQRAGVAAIIMSQEKVSINETKFGQPYAIVVYNQVQYKVNLRYLALDEKFIDFKNGIEGCAFIFPSISTDNNRVTSNALGASMFLSPRLMSGFLSQKYLLNDPFKKFPNFKIAYIESNPIVSNLRSQGMNLPEFVYFQGIQGPIKIWKIEYTGDEKIKQEYLDINAKNYLTWQL